MVPEIQALADAAGVLGRLLLAPCLLLAVSSLLLLAGAVLGALRPVDSAALGSSEGALAASATATPAATPPLPTLPLGSPLLVLSSRGAIAADSLDIARQGADTLLVENGRHQGRRCRLHGRDISPLLVVLVRGEEGTQAGAGKDAVE